MKVKFTRHAISRWEERFPGLDKEKEWDESLPASKSVLKNIRGKCPANAHRVRNKNPFYKYMLSTNMVVFAYDTSGVVITVFPLSLPHANDGYEWRIISNRLRHTAVLKKIKKAISKIDPD